MWLIAGTVPANDFSLHIGLEAAAQVRDDSLCLADGRALPVARGTTALVATAILACEYLGITPPRLLLAGDVGTGEGSREAYEWLAENIGTLAEDNKLKGITFHYFYPDVDGHDRLWLALETLPRRPLLVADAGFMYVAKMSGYASGYDLFTPDIGELAFLADEKAPHPFYTRGFLLGKEDDVPGLLERALKNGGCPANMIIKGATDYIVCAGRIVATVGEPAAMAMECIGGTGDIVAGFATAWLAAGLSVCESCLRAARAARFLAEFCRPDPSWQAARLIAAIRPMLAKYENLIEK